MTINSVQRASLRRALEYATPNYSFLLTFFHHPTILQAIKPDGYDMSFAKTVGRLAAGVGHNSVRGPQVIDPWFEDLPFPLKNLKKKLALVQESKSEKVLMVQRNYMGDIISFISDASLDCEAELLAPA